VHILGIYNLYKTINFGVLTLALAKQFPLELKTMIIAIYRMTYLIQQISTSTSLARL